MPQTIFVTGATGRQGSGLVHTLLSSPSTSDVTIHALTRDPSSPSAKALQTKYPNLKFFPGSFENVSSITDAATNCTSAFLNVLPVMTDQTAEARHIHNLIEACSNIPSITRIVFSSTGALHAPKLSEIFSEYIPNNPQAMFSAYMPSKKVCEDAITTSSFPEGWAMLRGYTFFTNFLKPFSQFLYPELESKQTMTTAFGEGYKIGMIDPADIGALAATMLTSTPGEWDRTWRGKIVPLASESITMDEMIGMMNQALAKRGVEKRVKHVKVGEKDAEEKVKDGDILLGSQLFQTKYFPELDPEEMRAFGIDVDKLVKGNEFFDREAQMVIETVGGA